MYIVQYTTGSHEEFKRHNIFVTENLETATKYVRKFNRIFKKWKKYYTRFETVRGYLPDEYLYLYDRWDFVTEINYCFFKKIEKR